MNQALINFLLFMALWFGVARSENELLQIIPSLPAVENSNTNRDAGALQVEQAQIDPAQLRLMYPFLLRDSEHPLWQPLRVSSLRANQMREGVMPPVQEREARYRRAPSMMEQWGDFYKAMDNVRKPRFGR